MEQKELLEKTKLLIDKLSQYNLTKKLRWADMDEKLMVKTVVQNIYGNVNLDLACDNCMLHYLNLLVPFYEREYPKYVSTLAKEIVVEAKTEVEVVKPVSKPKRSKK